MCELDEVDPVQWYLLLLAEKYTLHCLWAPPGGCGGPGRGQHVVVVVVVPRVR